MTAVFERILEMSLTAAVVIVVVMVIRLLLHKAPRKYSYALWSVAAFRLVCPVSFRAVFSLFNFTKGLDQGSMESILPDPVVSPAPVVSPGYFDSAPPNTGAPVEIDPDYVFTTYPLITPPAVETPAAPINWMEVLSIVWLIGLAALVIYGIISYVRLRRKMGTAILLEGNVWQSDRVQSPFILGFVRPKIYLPFGLSADQQRYVLAHERYHIKRFDHIVRPMSFLILAVHWFNPLVWVAYYMMGRDMEMSCDEKVLSSGESVKAYSTTLLSFAANRRFPSPSPLAFGESGVKSRIKNALNWKKPRTWVTIAAIVVCIVIIVVCAANPVEAKSDAYDWFASLTEANLDSAQFVLATETDNYIDLTEDQKRELVSLLQRIKKDECDWYAERGTSEGLSVDLRADYEQFRSDYDPSLPEDCRIVMEAQNGDSFAILDYGPNSNSIGLILLKDTRETIETRWSIDNAELVQFMAGLADSVMPEGNDRPISGELLTYVSTQCIYMNPLSSSLSASDSGKTYLIGDSMVAIFDKRDNDAGIFFETLPEWRPLTEEEWAGMFLFQGSVVSISHYRNPMILDLSEEYQLVNVEGTLWMVHCYGDSGIWDIYQLAPANQTATIAQWQVDLTGDGVDETITVEGVIAEGVGYYVAATLAVADASGKGLWSDGFSLGSDEVADFYLIETDGKYSILEWSAMERENVLAYSYGITELDGKSAGARYETLRCGLSDEELAALDLYEVKAYFDTVQVLMEHGTLLLGGTSGEIIYSTPENRFTSVWPSPLEKLQQAQGGVLTLATWQADLTHDGVKESLWLTCDKAAMLYTLAVTDMSGTELWKAEVGTFPMFYNGFYLYERGGKQYLMQWHPSGRQSSYGYGYEIFHLTEPGEKTVLASNSMIYDARYDSEILAIDTQAIRDFEAEVNALLKDAVLLVKADDEGVRQGNPSDPVTSLWTSPADDWEEQQQAILNSQADREDRTLAVWPLNDLTVTVLKTEDEYAYVLDVYGNDYFYWSTELRTWPSYGDTIYLVYRENGVEYLAEFTGTSRQGTGMYSYRVFTVRPESLDVLYENSLFYEEMSVETLLAVDTEAIRAFEDEVNSLFSRNANVICGVSDGQMFWYPGGSDIVFRWSSPADEIEERQSYWREMERALRKAVAVELNRYYVENLMQSGGKGHGQFVMLDKYMNKQGAEAYVVASFIETDREGNFLAEYSNIPMMFTFDLTDDEYVLTEAWVQEKGKNFDAHDDVKERFPAEAAQTVIDGVYVEQLRQSIYDTMEEQPAYEVTVAAEVEHAGGVYASDTVLDYAASYIRQTCPDAQAARIDALEERSTGAVGTTSGDLLYRLDYSVREDSKWQNAEPVYLVVHLDWSSSSMYINACGVVTQQEINTTYSSEAMKEQYGDPYLAAVLEVAKEWSANQ